MFVVEITSHVIFECQDILSYCMLQCYQLTSVASISVLGSKLAEGFLSYTLNYQSFTQPYIQHVKSYFVA